MQATFSGLDGTQRLHVRSAVDAVVVIHCKSMQGGKEKLSMSTPLQLFGVQRSTIRITFPLPTQKR